MHEKWNLCLHFSKATTEESEFSLDGLGAAEKIFEKLNCKNMGGGDSGHL